MFFFLAYFPLYNRLQFLITAELNPGRVEQKGREDRPYCPELHALSLATVYSRPFSSLECSWAFRNLLSHWKSLTCGSLNPFKRISILGPQWLSTPHTIQTAETDSCRQRFTQDGSERPPLAPTYLWFLDIQAFVTPCHTQNGCLALAIRLGIIFPPLLKFWK